MNGGVLLPHANLLRRHQPQPPLFLRGFADRRTGVALGERLIEATALGHRAAPADARIMFLDAVSHHAQEGLQRNRLAAVILGLGHHRVAGIGPGELRVLGQIASEIAERALDRLGLAMIRRGEMHLRAQLRQHAQRLVVFQFEAIPGARPTGNPLGSLSPAVIEPAMIGDAELLHQIANRQPQRFLVRVLIHPPGQNFAGINILDRHHLRPAHAAVRPLHEHIPLVEVGVHRLQRVKHAVVALLRRVAPLQRLFALAQLHHQFRRQLLQPSLQHGTRGQHPAMRFRRRGQQPPASLKRRLLQPQINGFQIFPGFRRAFRHGCAPDMPRRQKRHPVRPRLPMDQALPVVQAGNGNPHIRRQHGRRRHLGHAAALHLPPRVQCRSLALRRVFLLLRLPIEPGPHLGPHQIVLRPRLRIGLRHPHQFQRQLGLRLHRQQRIMQFHPAAAPAALAPGFALTVRPQPVMALGHLQNI